jgi:hypothetical protein
MPYAYASWSGKYRLGRNANYYRHKIKVANLQNLLGQDPILPNLHQPADLHPNNPNCLVNKQPPGLHLKVDPPLQRRFH